MPIRWSDEQKNYLKKNYGKIPTKEIALYLGKNYQSVVQYAHKNGFQTSRYMTDADKKYIDKWLGKKSLREIAAHTGKAYNTIRKYIWRNGYGRSRDADEKCMTITAVSELVGRDRSTIQKTWTKHGFKITKVGRFLMINTDELLEFMKSHPERWDATKCEKWYFEHYDWWREKRKTDFEKMKAARWAHEKTLKGA